MDFVVPWLDFTFSSRAAGVLVRKIYFFCRALQSGLGGLIYGTALVRCFYYEADSWRETNAKIAELSQS